MRVGQQIRLHTFQQVMLIRLERAIGAATSVCGERVSHFVRPFLRCARRIARFATGDTAGQLFSCSITACVTPPSSRSITRARAPHAQTREAVASSLIVSARRSASLCASVGSASDTTTTLLTTIFSPSLSTTHPFEVYENSNVQDHSNSHKRTFRIFVNSHFRILVNSRLIPLLEAIVPAFSYEKPLAQESL